MANDGYEVYFAEKLWELIPGIHRDRDGREEGAGTLRALVEIYAREAAKIRRSQDHLWDDAFIELSDDWAIAYIGELVDTRMLSALNNRGNRISVAKKIHYQRRSGTRPVLEELVSDITGYEGIVTEGFRRLARAWHRLDPVNAYTTDDDRGPGAGGLVDLRSPRLLDLAGGPFDTFSHMPDIRRPGAIPMPGSVQRTLAPLDVLEGADATAGIRKIGFHFYRLNAFFVEGVNPAAGFGTTGFHFDPSGRDIALFQVSTRLAGGSQGLRGTGFPDWRAAQNWEVPAPMLCRVLGHAQYVISEMALAALESVPGMNAARLDQLRRLRGQRLTGEDKLQLVVSRLPDAAFFTQTATLTRIRAAALSANCGKAVLLNAPVSSAQANGSVSVEEAAGNPIPQERVTAAGLAAWSVSAQGRRVAIDPENGRLRFIGAAPANPPTVSYAYGTPGPVGAGPHARPEAVARDVDSTIQGGGSITAADLPSQGVVSIGDSATYDVTPGQTAVRDLVVQAAEGTRPYLARDANWTFLSATDNAQLVLDGLWIGGAPSFSIRLRGSYARVRVANSTIDPGGAQSRLPGSPQIPNVRLVISGEVDRLEIDHSICGEISTFGSGQVNRLVIRDSIIASAGIQAAIDLDAGEVIMERVSVLGNTIVHRLYATETLLQGVAQVRDNQAGCFRFGAYEPPSRLPKPYQSHVLDPGTPVFTSRRFGDPGYCQINIAAPDFLQTGAEHGSQIGAYSSLNEPIRIEGLRQKASEYMPFGLVPFFIAET